MTCKIMKTIKYRGCTKKLKNNYCILIYKYLHYNNIHNFLRIDILYEGTYINDIPSTTYTYRSYHITIPRIYDLLVNSIMSLPLPQFNTVIYLIFF